MSVSLWRWSEKCEGKPCCGDCDECGEEDAEEKTEEQMLEDDEEKYVLTPWGCLYMVLTDYGVDVKNIPGRIGVHIVEDFMDEMVRAGHLAKMEDNDA